ncbi:MAG: abortive infection family protein [Methyloceanibacter sp.]
MPGPSLVSRRTRNAFREAFSGWETLRTIDMAFENEDFQPNLSFEPPGVSGQRRWLVEQYYAAIDFGDPKQVFRLLRVFEDLASRIERTNPEEASHLRRMVERDGYRFEDGRLIARNPLARFQDLRAAAEELRSGDIIAHVERIEAAVDTDPSLAVGSAKELLETTCKAILAACQVEIQKADDIPQLMRKTMKALSLLPDDIPERVRGVDTIRRLLNNLATTVTGLAEIRNLYGTGHGRHGTKRGLSPRHAKLAAGAASTLAVFLLETHEERP